MKHQRRRALSSGILAAALAAAPALALTGQGSAAQAAEAPLHVRLLNINDFHGRIDANTVKFAGTVEELKAGAPDGNAVFLSAGDNIGASLFASSSQQDQPTIDVLNTLGLSASSVGNHEFDRGFADLQDRVVAGGSNAAFAYLGANVYRAGTSTPALPEYEIVDVNGVKVAVIGVVTQETPSLVSPGGISGLDFGDPTDAVNRVAGQIKASGTADVIVAEYHEGAGAGTPDGATLEQELAAGGAFAKLATQTTADVAAIFTGHTHKQYAWDAPVPGQPGKTRPILQTGSYGEFVGKIDLTIDPVTKEVLSYHQENVARSTAEDAAITAVYPKAAEVDAITDAALAKAAQIGEQPVGSLTADVTTAYAGGKRDDRSSSSTLGSLVADSLLSSLTDPRLGGAEIAVVNPGGLRADLFYAADPKVANDTNGVISFAEANAVLPFVNNLWTTSLTGTQLKTLLEQQWQRTSAGEVPSRPYLQLGTSSNLTYTFDSTRPEGDRITSVLVNGEAVDPARSYRVGTFSFLAQGGDNFHALADGADTRDSGLIDRDAWIAYLGENKALTPDFAKRSAELTGLPSGPLAPGTELSFAVNGLDLTSLGSPVNASVRVEYVPAGDTDPRVLGTFPVSGGAAQLTFALPEDADAGSLRLVAAESGTTVRVPLEILAAVVPTPTPTPTPSETATSSPSPSATPAPSETVEPSQTAVPSPSTSAAVTPSAPAPVATDDGGSLAETGAGAALPLGLGALALAGLGAALVIAARTRKGAHS